MFPGLFYKNHGFDACMIEALACRDALRIAKLQGLQRVHLDIDLFELIQVWNKRYLQRVVI